MNSVNFELMQSLLQVTLQSKTVETANTKSDSSASFETILNDMNEKGIKLTEEEIKNYEVALEENDVDLEELHQLLASLNVNLEDESVETETNELLALLMEALNSEQNVVEPEITEEVVLDTNVVTLNVEEEQELTVEFVETTNKEINLSEVEIKVDENNESTEVEAKEESNDETDEVKVEIKAEATTENVEAQVIVAAPVISEETVNRTTKETVESTKEVTNEIKVELHNVTDTFNYVAKPEYHEPHFDTNQNVIVSDNDVLKLDLMFKDMFKEEAPHVEQPVINHENTLVTEENVEVISHEEASDFEKAYLALNNMRPLTQTVPVDVNKQVIVNNAEAETNEFGFTMSEAIDIANQVGEGFAKQVDLSEEFIIKLKPEGLGEIVVRMVSDTEGHSAVSMITNNEHVKAILESDMASLKSALVNQNVEIKEVVYDDQSSYFSDSNFTNQSQTNQNNHSKENNIYSSYYQNTDENDEMVAPINYYYGDSRLHQYA